MPRKSMPIDAFCGLFQHPARMKCPMKNPSNEASHTTFFTHDAALKPRKHDPKSIIEVANSHHPSLIPRDLVMVKGGSFGAVAEAISPLTILSPQAS